MQDSHPAKEKLRIHMRLPTVLLWVIEVDLPLFKGKNESELSTFQSEPFLGLLERHHHYLQANSYSIDGKRSSCCNLIFTERQLLIEVVLHPENDQNRAHSSHFSLVSKTQGEWIVPYSQTTSYLKTSMCFSQITSVHLRTNVPGGEDTLQKGRTYQIHSREHFQALGPRALGSRRPPQSAYSRPGSA